MYWKIIMARVLFINRGEKDIQVRVIASEDRNFTLRKNESDDSFTYDEGSQVKFWWRDDGSSCKNCEVAIPTCSRNIVTISNSDLIIELPSVKYNKQTN